jgi:hypothetical protein
MTVQRIDALCECEGCGKRFGIELDTGEDLNSYADFEALVRDTILGGQALCYTWGIRGKSTVDRLSLSYNVTIQADLMLCDVCSKKCDDLPIEAALTRAEVNRALGLFKDTR